MSTKLKLRLKCALHPSKEETIFNAYCATLFASHLWSQDLHNSYRRMRVVFNDKFRMLFDLPRYASASEHQVTFNIVTFDALICKQLFAFISRLAYAKFSLVKLLFTSPYRKHYENMLF